MERANEESIVPGSSLARTVTQLNKHYGIVCGIVVQNRTNMELSSPHATITAGSLIKSPGSVSPGQIESVIAHKYWFSMKGTSGLVSWLLSGLERRVVVMWDVPFFQSTNILAVGITTKKNTVHNGKWYTEIENSSYNRDLNFNRGTYYANFNEIMIADECIEVLGTMGTGRASEVNITVRSKRNVYFEKIRVFKAGDLPE